MVEAELALDTRLNAEAALGRDTDGAGTAGSLNESQAARRGGEGEALNWRGPRPVIYQVRRVDGPNSSCEVPSCRRAVRRGVRVVGSG